MRAWKAIKGFSLLFVLFVFWACLVVANQPGADNVPRPIASTKERAAPQWDKSPVAQEERRVFIQGLFDRNAFSSIDFAGGDDPSVDVWVRSAFVYIDYKKKTTVAQTIYRYYFDGSEDFAIVRFLDSATGKTLGSITKNGGFGWDAM